MDQPNAEQGSVRIEDSVKEFATERGVIRAVGPVSLDIRPGEFISIVGPSGCGKSTLLSLVAGLTSSTSGSITVSGDYVDRPHRDISMMFQSDLLMDWLTVSENILLQAKMRGRVTPAVRQRVDELLRIAQLEGFGDRRPWELSGGMRQRVAICRTLLNDPKVILMDEPFGALDAMTRDHMGTFLEEIWAHLKATVIFVTHSIEEAIILSDRVVVMTHRPGLIAEIVDINLPRPRSKTAREDPQFGELFTRIDSHFREEAVSG